MSKKDKADKKNKTARKKEARQAALHELLPAITQTARTLRTALSRSLADSGLYAGQDGVMQALADEDGLTPGQLAAALGVKAPTMTRTIVRMEAQGFVERRSDTTDARLTKVFLSEAGRASLDKIAEAGASCEGQAVRGLSAKEVHQLVKLLVVVEGNLRNSPED